jgi:hypothetical protein
LSLRKDFPLSIDCPVCVDIRFILVLSDAGDKTSDSFDNLEEIGYTILAMDNKYRKME